MSSSATLTTGSRSYAQTYSSRPSRGTVGIACLILTESALFIIFVVAYVFYLGKSLSGPTPHDVLDLPILASICLFSSSVTVHLGVSALGKNEPRRATGWIGLTALLGLAFLGFTASEWYGLIVHHGFTIRTNLFGTTFYALVGLHATHVVVGVSMLGLVTFFGLTGRLHLHDHHRLEILSYYWHFVDAVWVVVLTVVYILGR